MIVEHETGDEDWTKLQLKQKSAAHIVLFLQSDKALKGLIDLLPADCDYAKKRRARKRVSQ